MVTQAADPPGWVREQALIEALEELRRASDDIRITLRGVNDEAYGTKLDQALDIAGQILAIHLPDPGYRVVGALEVLYRATRNLRPLIQDEDLQAPTPTRTTIREALGALRMALDDSLEAARQAFGEGTPIPGQRKALGSKVTAEQVDKMIADLAAFQTKVNEIALEADTAPDFAQQGSQVRYYVREMTLEIDSAGLHLTVNGSSLDLGALVHTIEDIREVTGSFRATVLDWWEYATETLLKGTDDLRPHVDRLTAGVRALGGMIGAGDSDAPDMVLIPRGSFAMGIPPEESKREGTEDWDRDARPVHTVTFARPFLMGRAPVTVAEYSVFVQETGRAWEKPDFPQTGRHPVVNVSWDDAIAYAAWLSARTGDPYRLPSEAEWEYACRAGTATSRWWGSDHDPKMANVATEGTTEVGAFPANPWGLFDMIGNALEWVEDRWHGSYRGAPRDGQAWTTGNKTGRVLRGGSWNGNLRYDRADIRVRSRGPTALSWVGLRLARTL